MSAVTRPCKWPGQTPGVHDHKPYEDCYDDCPVHATHWWTQRPGPGAEDVHDRLSPFDQGANIGRRPMRERPRDPVLDFIYDPAVRRLITDGMERWPWSRLSGSRLNKIGYKLVVLRCAQLGIEPPHRTEAASWRT